MSNLIPNHDLQMDWRFQREMDRRVDPVDDEEDEGDGFPEPCEVARAFVENQVEMVEMLQANRETRRTA